MGGIYGVRHCDGIRWHYLHYIGSGIQIILRVIQNNMKGYNIGVTDGRDV
jgi:hypothetical protein